MSTIACLTPGCRRPRANKSTVCGTCRGELRKAKRRTGSEHNRGNTLALTAEQDQEARRMYAAFKSYEDIGRHFGVSRKTAKAAVDRAKKARAA